LKFNTQLPDDEVNVTKSSALADLTWMLGGLSAIVLVLYFGFGFLVEYGVKNISVEQEQKFFSYVNFNEILQEEEKDANQSLKLQAILDATKECSKTSYNFKLNIPNTDEINAFAVPGGLIVINQALIDNSTSENEIFFALAHEIGHFNNRDHLEGVGRGFVALAITTMIGFSEASDLLDTSLNFSESHFSQETESDADLFAVDLMNCYYGHVNGSTDFFKHLPENDNIQLFSSHPATLKRIEKIEAYIAENGYIKKDKIDFTY